MVGLQMSYCWAFAVGSWPEVRYSRFKAEGEYSLAGNNSKLASLISTETIRRRSRSFSSALWLSGRQLWSGL